MLQNKKRVFWEALLLTLVIFVLGILIGISFESKKLDQVNEYYMKSETSLMDILAINSLIDFETADCDLLINSNMELANRIYEEAYLLEKYEESGKVTEGLKLAHEKYDVLRTFVWINSMKTLEKCEGDFDSVVYLYEYDPEDLTKKATQIVWSRILFELKQEKGNEMILIPIAVNNNISSLDLILSDMGIDENPIIIINDEFILEKLNSADDLKKYID